MSDQEHTLLTNFQIEKEWGDFTTLEERRFYLRRLIKYESGNLIRPADVHPGGYGSDTSNLFVVFEPGLEILFEHNRSILGKLSSLGSNIIFHSDEWNFLQQCMIPMSREYKIHLQPAEEFIPQVTRALVELILADDLLKKYVPAFKCKVVFQKQHSNFRRAVIILYLAILDSRSEARQMCSYVLRQMRSGLAEFESCSNGSLPIYNYPVTPLMSFIQIGTDAKFQLERILGRNRFDRLFPPKYYQALLMDEKIEYYL